jgi:hypothetical protein
MRPITAINVAVLLVMRVPPLCVVPADMYILNPLSMSAISRIDDLRLCDSV